MIDKSDPGNSAAIYQNSSQSSPLLLGAGVLGLPVGESAPPPPGDFMRAGAALLTGAGTLDADAGCCTGGSNCREGSDVIIPPPLSSLNTDTA